MQMKKLWPKRDKKFQQILQLVTAFILAETHMAIIFLKIVLYYEYDKAKIEGWCFIDHWCFSWAGG